MKISSSPRVCIGDNRGALVLRFTPEINWSAVTADTRSVAMLMHRECRTRLGGEANDDADDKDGRDNADSKCRRPPAPAHV
jgi:hypothetical protein